MIINRIGALQQNNPPKTLKKRQGISSMPAYSANKAYNPAFGGIKFPEPLELLVTLRTTEKLFDSIVNLGYYEGLKEFNRLYDYLLAFARSSKKWMAQDGLKYAEKNMTEGKAKDILQDGNHIITEYSLGRAKSIQVEGKDTPLTTIIYPGSSNFRISQKTKYGGDLIITGEINPELKRNTISASLNESLEDYQNLVAEKDKIFHQWKNYPEHGTRTANIPED